MADESIDQETVKSDSKPAQASAASVPSVPAASAASALPAGLVTFIPAITFTGYPEDYETNPAGVIFMAGVESIPVPRDFADLMKTKGLVADK